MVELEIESATCDRWLGTSQCGRCRRASGPDGRSAARAAPLERGMAGVCGREENVMRAHTSGTQPAVGGNAARWMAVALKAVHSVVCTAGQ
eukprot:1105875-Pleurochrysis_carterae.AAC.1